MEISSQDKSQALAAILSSADFAHSPKLAALLRFLAAQPPAEPPKETVIGVAVFGREPGYDPKTDPIVRVEVRRLRAKLLEYYDGHGRHDPWRIEIPKGAYAVQIHASKSSDAPASTRLPGFWLALAFVALAALWLGYVLARARVPALPADIPAPRQVTAHHFNSRSPAWAPDGRRLAISRDAEAGYSHILLIEPGQPERNVTSGAVRDFEPAWSPNGALGFLRETPRGFLLMHKDRSDQPEREIAVLRLRQPFSYSVDSRSVFVADQEAPGQAVRLWRVQIDSGQRSPLTAPLAGTVGDLAPRVSPDGTHLAFLRAVEPATRQLWLLPLAPLASPRPLPHDGRAVEGFDWTSDSQALIASLERGQQARSLWRIEIENGKSHRLAAAGMGPVAPSVNRVSNRVAYVVRIADTNIWRLDLGRRPNPRPLTSAIQLDTSSQISPDGGSIAFRSARSGANEVWVMSASGGAPRQLSFFDGPLSGSPRWSPDGSRLVLESRLTGNGDIYILSTTGGSPTPVTREASHEVLPSWSRDGRSLYFASDRTGRWEIFRTAVNGSAAVQITTQGGFAAFESPDGEYVYYTRLDEIGGIWRQPLKQPGPEEFMAPLSQNFWGQWAIGKRALYYLSVSADGRRQITRLDLANRQRRVVHQFTQLPVQFDSSMSVSPDESFLTWAQLDSSNSDVFVLQTPELAPLGSGK